MNKLGLETNKRHFSGSNLGPFTALASVDPKTRTRASSATAYYLPNASRTNLHVLTDATVEKIELENRNDEWVATGVSYLCGTQCYTARCKSEVIVCAGSIQSPQLLELSGIGDPDVLKAAGIPIKVGNHNVGENLQDHFSEFHSHLGSNSPSFKIRLVFFPGRDADAPAEPTHRHDLRSTTVLTFSDISDNQPVTTMIYEIDPTLTGPDELRANPLLAEAAQKVYETSQSGIYAMLPCALSYASLPQAVSPPNLEPIIACLPSANGLRDEVLYKQFNQPRCVCEHTRMSEYNFLFFGRLPDTNLYLHYPCDSTVGRTRISDCVTICSSDFLPSTANFSL